MMMWGAWELHWIWMVVFWVVVVGLIVWAVARIAPSNRDRRPKSAREILDERYARGELDEEEYRRRRSELDH